MNKKLLATTILFTLTVALTALAQVEPTEISGCELGHDFSGWANVDCPASGDCNFDSTTYDCVICCTLDTVYTVTDWIFYIVVSFAIILVVLGAYKIMTAGGTPDNVNTGRNYIMWAMVGLGLALLAKSIPAIVKAVLRIS